MPKATKNKLSNFNTKWAYDDPAITITRYPQGHRYLVYIRAIMLGNN